MKKFIVLILALNMYLGVFAQFTPGDTLKYRISLKDKAATDYSLQKPEKYLSKKSIERRKKQGLPIDSTDLPVCRKYVDAIRKTGVHVLVTGKWDNFVTVSCNDSMLISEIAQLPFVRSTERVWKGITQRAFQRDSLINKPLRTDSLYGPAITQAAMSRVDLLHDAGFKGEGMTIAVIDAGFHNVDKIDAMKNRGFDFGDFEITKREILASISIIAMMLLIGFVISGRISNYILDRNEKYNKAIKIESSELFEYGMITNVGYAFVYGDLKAVDTVSYPEINGEYMYIEKIEEHYNMHTRTVTTTDSKGKTHTRTETYWSWDYAGSEEQRCSEITFLGHIFPSNKVEFPNTEHIDTIKESSHVRHKYYGVDTEYIGTIFTELRDKTISDNSSFYENSTIGETVDYLESDWELWLFWVIWIIVIGLCVFGFYYIDNEWIEN